MTTVNQSKRYLGNRSVYVGDELPETDLEDGFLFFKTGTAEGLYVYKNSLWEIASITGLSAGSLNINDLGGTPLNIINGGTGSTSAGTALTALGGVTLTQVQNYVQTPSQNSQGNKTVSTSTPTGGIDGDVWYQYE